MFDNVKKVEIFKYQNELYVSCSCGRKIKISNATDIVICKCGQKLEPVSKPYVQSVSSPVSREVPDFGLTPKAPDDEDEFEW